MLVGRAEAARPPAVRFVIHRQAVGDKHPLRERLSLLDCKRFISAVGHPNADMSEVVGEIIVRIDYADGVVQRKAVLEPE